jgi:hypothetical protein
MTLEAMLLVEVECEPSGVGIRTVPEAPGERALGAVGRAGRARDGTGGDANRLQDPLARAHVV